MNFWESAWKGKDMIIIDDMISSGESMLEVAAELKKRKANRIFIFTQLLVFSPPDLINLINHMKMESLQRYLPPI